MGNVAEAVREQIEYRKRLTEYVNTLRLLSAKEKLQDFADLRNFSLESVEKAGVFYIGNMAEMLLPTYLDEVNSFGVISNTNRMPIFRERYVIPIKDELGLVQNLVGYSREAAERYIYGTAKYYRRKETLWGLENIDLAYDMGYAILTEGITDAMMVRSLGYPNAFANCGTHHSKYIMNTLNRCRHGIVRIPDRDSAGFRALNGWVCNRHVTLNVPIIYKDADEMCREAENRDWFTSYLNDCINWLKSAEHNGIQCKCEQVTIM